MTKLDDWVEETGKGIVRRGVRLWGRSVVSGDTASASGMASDDDWD